MQRSNRLAAGRPLMRCLPFFLLMGVCPSAASVGAIEHWETDEGARVYFLAARELPIVDVRIVFDAGSARDGSHPGLAALTNGLLAEGAQGQTGEHLRERFADLGAEYEHGVDRDKAWVGARLLSDEDSRAKVSALLAILLAKPDFLPDAYTREKTRQLQRIRERSQSLRNIAEDAFFDAAYEGHPYAKPTLGTESTVATIARVDVELFHSRLYTARNAVVAIVGDLSKAAAQAIAARLSAELPVSDRLAPLPPAAATQTPPRAIVRESTQTHVWYGLPMMSHRDPDYFALYVGNHMLGGAGLVSRLFKVVREDQGLAYSTYSYVAPLRARGPFIAGLQTRNEKLGEALTSLRATIDEFVAAGPTADELTRAKQNIIGGFPLRIDSNRKMLAQLVKVAYSGLPLDYLDTFPSLIEAVTKEQVRDAFQRRLRAEQIVLVTVGGAAASD